MNRRSPLLIIVALVILALLGAGAYLWYAQQAPEVASEVSQPSAAPATAIPAPPTAAPPTPAPSPVPSATPTAEPVALVVPLPELPPPLANVKFPTQQIDYPTDWPESLRYPAEFKPVEISSATLVEGGAKSWAAKLRFLGGPSDAADALSTFFTSGGWKVAERIELESGGFTLLISRDDTQTGGIVVVDAEPATPGSTRVLSTVFL